MELQPTTDEASKTGWDSGDVVDREDVVYVIERYSSWIWPAVDIVEETK